LTANGGVLSNLSGQAGKGTAWRIVAIANRRFVAWCKCSIIQKMFICCQNNLGLTLNAQTGYVILFVLIFVV